MCIEKTLNNLASNIIFGAKISWETKNDRLVIQVTDKNGSTWHYKEYSVDETLLKFYAKILRDLEAYDFCGELASRYISEEDKENLFFIAEDVNSVMKNFRIALYREYLKLAAA